MKTQISVVVAALLLGCLATESRADLLPPAECDALRSKHQSLSDAEMAADLKRGPEWAKTNLAPERLEKMDRLLRLEEQLAFRCPAVQAKDNLVVLRPQPKVPANNVSDGKPVRIETGTLKSADPAGKRPANTIAKQRLSKTTAKRRAKKSKGRDVYVPPPPGLGYSPGGYTPE